MDEVWDGCGPEELCAAPAAALRAQGPMLSMSCGLRLQETPVDEAYKAACRKKAERLAASLSQRRAGSLEPIAPEDVDYRWNLDGGCISYTTSEGEHTGVCPVYGIARIPLRWRDAAALAP